MVAKRIMKVIGPKISEPMRTITKIIDVIVRFISEVFNIVCLINEM